MRLAIQKEDCIFIIIVGLCPLYISLLYLLVRLYIVENHLLLAVPPFLECRRVALPPP